MITLDLSFKNGTGSAKVYDYYETGMKKEASVEKIFSLLSCFQMIWGQNTTPYWQRNTKRPV